MLRGSAVVGIAGVVVIDTAGIAGIALLLLLLGLSFGCTDLGILLSNLDVRYDVKGVIGARLSVKLTFSKFGPAISEIHNKSGPFLVWNIGAFERQEKVTVDPIGWTVGILILVIR